MKDNKYLKWNNTHIEGDITLDKSKSISNRILIIYALAGVTINREDYSFSDDSQVLYDSILKFKSNTSDNIYDIGHAGTSFRFLTSFFSIQKGSQILTGSDRMKERPVGPLVDALRSIGAHIEYLEKDGYPPLRINGDFEPINNHIKINASISSQFITSLLLISPYIPGGLTIEMLGKQVSTPYIKMTTKIMNSFQVVPQWIDFEGQNSIVLTPGNYIIPPDLLVESDWSSASYYYIIAAFSKSCNIRLNGLFQESLQADQEIANLGTLFGIKTSYTDEGIRIEKKETLLPDLVEMDFTKCPDIAQTMMTIVGGLGLQGLYSGLSTLKIKETDRIAAMKNELGKVGVHITKLPGKFSTLSDKEFYMSEGKACLDAPVEFNTYHDHRMAMSLAPLSLFFKLKINDINVVNKSYPNFWKDLSSIGLTIE